MYIETASTRDSNKLEAFLPSTSGENQEVNILASTSEEENEDHTTDDNAEKEEKVTPGTSKSMGEPSKFDETLLDSISKAQINAEQKVAQDQSKPRFNLMYRASTARVDLSEIRERLEQMEQMLLAESEIKDEVTETRPDNSIALNTCEYDLTKHTISYLPTPIMSQAENKDKSGTMRNLKDNTKFLGVQSSIKRSSIFVPADVDNLDIDMDPQFDSVFGPNDMRLLALVSHNNMKQSMKQFVIANMNILKKFRLTGTNTTMSMLKEVFGDDPDVVYGPSCKSGPLGGDAQLVAMAVTGQLGGCIFFIDPMDAHPHSADIECLVRQGNVHNVLMMNNPTTAHVCMNTLRVALKMGRMEMIPSFFFDLESPSVEAYKARQKNVLKNAISRMSTVVATRENKVAHRMRKANAEYEKYQNMKKSVTFNSREDMQPDVTEITPTSSANASVVSDKEEVENSIALL